MQTHGLAPSPRHRPLAPIDSLADDALRMPAPPPTKGTVPSLRTLHARIATQLDTVGNIRWASPHIRQTIVPQAQSAELRQSFKHARKQMAKGLWDPTVDAGWHINPFNRHKDFVHRQMDVTDIAGLSASGRRHHHALTCLNNALSAVQYEYLWLGPPDQETYRARDANELLRSTGKHPFHRNLAAAIDTLLAPDPSPWGRGTRKTIGNALLQTTADMDRILVKNVVDRMTPATRKRLAGID